MLSNAVITQDPPSAGGCPPVRNPLASGLAESKIPGLDGLRAIAVFLVIFDHFGIPGAPGGLGVLIFFVISGFLITWLLMKEREKRGHVSLRRFYARRALRIFPAFYAYALLSLSVLIAFHKHVDWHQATAALFYVSNYYQAILGDPNTALSHTWSLSVEEQFYLIWPPLFIFLAPKGRSLMLVPAVLVVIEWIYRAILQFGFHVWQGYFYEAFDTRFDSLLIGCLLGIVLFKTREHPAWSKLAAMKWLPFVTVGLLSGSAALELVFGTGYRDSVGFLANPILTAMLIPQLIAFRGSWFAAWLQWRPVSYLGSISYSLYLYQQMILYPIRHALSAWPIPVQLAIAVALVVGAAAASHNIVEKPFLRLKDRSFAA